VTVPNSPVKLPVGRMPVKTSVAYCVMKVLRFGKKLVQDGILPPDTVIRSFVTYVNAVWLIMKTCLYLIFTLYFPFNASLFYYPPPFISHMTQINPHSYQTHYQPYIGKAKLNKKVAIAGSVTDLTLTYTVGKHGIDESGGIKVLFRIASDIGRLQFNAPKKPNYVSTRSSKKSAVLTPSSPSTGCKGKQHIRPWAQGFTLHLTESYLSEGDIITIEFKNLQLQTYSEKEFQFRIAVDPFATASYIEMEYSPSIELQAGPPAYMNIVIPTATQVGKEFSSILTVEDIYHNACALFSGDVVLQADSQNIQLPKKAILPDSQNIQLPKKAILRNGRAEIKTRIMKPGSYTIQGQLSSVHARSNPTLCEETVSDKYYWADLHGQSNETVGTNTVEDYYAFARAYGGLDVTCHQGNDFQISNEFWNNLNNTAKRHNKENDFVAFPGYEWSGNTSVGGDHNIIYKKQGMPLLRSSHALVEDLSDVATDTTHVQDLFKKLDHKNTFTIAHVGGRFANLGEHLKTSPLDAVEVHSDWGTFEWILEDAFKKGLRVGVVANSDGHKGTPGASYPGSSHFGCQGGLTCIRAKKLTRNKIFDALKKHHTYATTGVRILLDVRLTDAYANLHAVIGDQLSLKNISDPLLHIRTITTNPLERIEVYSDTKCLTSFYAPIEDKAVRHIKIQWSGASARGRSRKYSWNGTIQVEGGSIKKKETFNFFSSQDTINFERSSLTFSGTTTGGVQGCIIAVDKKATRLIITIQGKEIILPLSEVSAKPKRYTFGKLNALFEVHETIDQDAKCDFEHSLSIPKPTKKNTPLYVKVYQRDGHRAWSSPLYISE